MRRTPADRRAVGLADRLGTNTNYPRRAIDLVDRTIDQVGFGMLLDKGQLVREARRTHDIVAIHSRHLSSSRHPNRLVESASQVMMLSVGDDTDPRIPNSVQQGRSLVGRTIIRHDEFPVVEALRKNRCGRLAEG
jgi:hypothetical protein